MKKIFFAILSLTFIFILTGCQDKTIEKTDLVTMTLTDEWKKVITANGEFPSLSFEFEGTFNVYETSSNIGYVFTKNDNYKLSDAFEKHWKEKIQNNYIITNVTNQEYDKDGAIFGNDTLPLDEGTTSNEYTVVAWDESGTRYSYLYRLFFSGGKVYYAYTYGTGITMNIDIPLLIQKVDGKQQIYMISLPYDTIYKANINTKIKSLLNKEEYLKEEYHTFVYPNYLKNSQDKIQAVKDWYIKYCDGREENGAFVYTYIGIDYRIEFYETHFKMYVK